MTHQAKAKIFIADERSCNETAKFRSYNTFNFGKYFNEYKRPFEDLYVLNDDTIGPLSSISVVAKENSYLLLLPIVGILGCKDEKGNKFTIHPGQLQLLHVKRGATIELLNCNENELINFIQLWIKTESPDRKQANDLSFFNLDDNKNQLIPINSSARENAKYPLFSIGKFSGRQEAVYTWQNEKNYSFVFVVEGVFEVQGTLLHARDGLALWNDGEDIELEALSNEAILFMLELSK